MTNDNDHLGRLIVKKPKPHLFSLRVVEGTPEGDAYDMAKRLNLNVSPVLRGIIRSHRALCDHAYNSAPEPRRRMFDEAVKTLSIMQPVIGPDPSDQQFKDKIYRILYKRKHPLAEFIKDITLLEFTMLIHRSRLHAAELQG